MRRRRVVFVGRGLVGGSLGLVALVAVGLIAGLRFARFLFVVGGSRLVVFILVVVVVIGAALLGFVGLAFGLFGLVRLFATGLFVFLGALTGRVEASLFFRV